jgi:hypothetical protein
MKKIKSLDDFKIGKKYLFICKSDKSLGVSTDINNKYVKFKIYQSTYKDLPSGTECYLDNSSFNIFTFSTVKISLQ